MISNIPAEAQALTLYNSTGLLVRSLPVSEHSVMIVDRENLSNGLYFVKIIGRDAVIQTIKVVLID
ncbi:MAG: T9SS type A sorting domain-containing protein [Bacteroidetes bacterium]|nr:T9SS type A sorting domain-containing protein [Bacteroidota bacterium]